jgi:Flp pilus assembly protein TadB
MNTTPNTFAYMIAGYAVFAVVMAAYLVSLILRFRRLRSDLRLLEEIETK